MKITYPTLKRWIGKSAPSDGIELIQVDCSSVLVKESTLSVSMDNGLKIDFPTSLDQSLAVSWIGALKSC
jgi:hypothetical protein